MDRHPLTQPRAGDDTSPTASPDGAFVAFVREEHLMRVDLADGRVRRLTGGFKRERSPRVLPTGRIACARITPPTGALTRQGARYDPGGGS